MKKLLVLFLMLTFVFTMLFGCSGQGNDANNVNSGHENLDNPTDVLVIGTASLGTENFNIRQTATLLTPLTQQRLFRCNYSDEYAAGREEWGPQGELATGYDMSDDGLTYTIYLRQGVQWHGGYGEFTADDVDFTFSQMADPELDSTGLWYFADSADGGFIKDWKVIDKYTIEIHLSRLESLFIYDLADSCCHIFCKNYIEQVGWDTASLSPIGTGPWVFDELIPGDSVSLVRNDNYWGKASDFAGLRLKLVTDSAAMMMMLQNGQIDMAQINADQAEDAENAGLHIIEIKDVQVMTLCFGGQLLASDSKYDPTVPWANHSEEPLNSEWNQRALKVRQALCYAIDKDAIMNDIVSGYCSPAPLREFPYCIPETDPSWTQYPYDPAKAKELLSEAGYPNGFDKPIEMLIDNMATYGVDTPKIGNAIADYLGAIGLKVKRTVLDSNSIYDKWKEQRDCAWCMMVDYGIVCPDPAWAWPWSRISTAGEFVTANFHQTDDYINKVLMTLDSAERSALERECGQFLYDNYTECALLTASTVYACNSTIGDWHPRSSYEMTLNWQMNLEGIEKAQ